MGGTLVTRNQIGVDHRYAGAGKWKDESLDAADGRPIVAGGLDDLQVNQMKLLRVGPKRIVLARTEQGYAAFADPCSHRGASLADGVMICGTVQCPWHGSQFDARTGDVKAGPAQQAIEVYNVREQDGRVLLDL
jgi:nitrite reductase/ring-hydroxylating ferredoxin subunit